MMRVIQECPYISGVLDNEWYSEIISQILSAKIKSSGFESPRACMLFQLRKNHKRIHRIERRLSSAMKLNRQFLNILRCFIIEREFTLQMAICHQ